MPNPKLSSKQKPLIRTCNGWMQNVLAPNFFKQWIMYLIVPNVETFENINSGFREPEAFLNTVLMTLRRTDECSWESKSPKYLVYELGLSIKQVLRELDSQERKSSWRCVATWKVKSMHTTKNIFAPPLLPICG